MFIFAVRGKIRETYRTSPTDDGGWYAIGSTLQPDLRALTRLNGPVNLLCNDVMCNYSDYS